MLAKRTTTMNNRLAQKKAKLVSLQTHWEALNTRTKEMQMAHVKAVSVSFTMSH